MYYENANIVAMPRRSIIESPSRVAHCHCLHYNNNDNDKNFSIESRVFISNPFKHGKTNKNIRIVSKFFASLNHQSNTSSSVSSPGPTYNYFSFFSPSFVRRDYLF